MALGEAVVIVAGLGCRRGTGAPEIEAALAEALRFAGRAAGEVRCLATASRKAGEPGIVRAAERLGLPLVLVPDAELDAATARAETRSERVRALFGVPSVAEAAALVGAGPAAHLLGPRLVLGPATCALAEEIAS